MKSIGLLQKCGGFFVVQRCVTGKIYDVFAWRIEGGKVNKKTSKVCYNYFNQFFTICT